MNYYAKHIADKLDDATMARSIASPFTRTLCLNDGDSPFLRAVKTRCELLDLPYKLLSEGVTADWDGPILHDREITDKPPDGGDIDHIATPGMSSCAEAMLMLLVDGNLYGKHIVIVGRGHAVKGLAEALTKLNATVSLCNSHTSVVTLRHLLGQADIVINSAPNLTFNRVPTETSYPLIVLDCSGALTEHLGTEIDPGDYYGPKDIGYLTTSVLLNRVANWK